MKKIIAALLTLVMVAALTACAADQTLKFNGIWNDGTTNSALELKDDGTAVMRLGTEQYAFFWTTKDYDTIVLSVEIDEGQEPQFVPEFPEAPQEEDAAEDEESAENEEATENETPAENEVATADETAPSEEAASGEEATTDEEAATDEGKGDDAADKPAENTTFNIKKQRIAVFEVTLSIRKGVMYLVIEEVNEKGIYYYDFSHLMEGVELKNAEYEYFPELSKKLKAIPFIKRSN